METIASQKNLVQIYYFLQPKSKQKAYTPIAIGVVIGNSCGPQLKTTFCACRPCFIFTAIAAQNHSIIITAFCTNDRYKCIIKPLGV
jgi:hypothetical protein